MIKVKGIVQIFLLLWACVSNTFSHFTIVCRFSNTFLYAAMKTVPLRFTSLFVFAMMNESSYADKVKILRH